MWRASHEDLPIGNALGPRSGHVSTWLWCVPGFSVGFAFALEPSELNTKYDRTKVPLYNGHDPSPPWQSSSPSVSTPFKQSTKQGHTRGASEVRCGTSSINFHALICTRPWCKRDLKNRAAFSPLSQRESQAHSQRNCVAWRAQMAHLQMMSKM